MAANIVTNFINRLDPGGIVQDFKDIAYLIFASPQRKYSDFSEAAGKALYKHDWIAAANSCAATKLLTHDDRVYCVYQSLQVFSEAMIRGEAKHPDYDAIYWRAIRAHIQLPKV